MDCHKKKKEKKRHKSQPPVRQRFGQASKRVENHLTLQLCQKKQDSSRKNTGLHVGRTIYMACRKRSKVMHSQRKKSTRVSLRRANSRC